MRAIYKHQFSKYPLTLRSAQPLRFMLQFNWFMTVNLGVLRIYETSNFDFTVDDGNDGQRTR